MSSMLWHYMSFCLTTSFATLGSPVAEVIRTPSSGDA